MKIANNNKELKEIINKIKLNGKPQVIKYKGNTIKIYIERSGSTVHCKFILLKNKTSR